MNTVLVEREPAIINEPLPSDGGLSAASAQRILTLFEGIAEYQDSHGITPNELSPNEIQLLGFVKHALHKEAVLTEAKEFYKDHGKADKDIKWRQDWIDMSARDARQDRQYHLNRWRNTSDRGELRKAQIIGENTVDMYTKRDEAKAKYATNLEDSATHFHDNEIVYKMQAIKEAQDKGIEIVYPPYTPALSRANLEKLGKEIKRGFEAEGYTPGSGSSDTQEWERWSEQSRVVFAKRAIYYLNNGGQLDEYEIDSLISGIELVRKFERRDQRESFDWIQYIGHDSYADNIKKMDEILVRLKTEQQKLSSK